MSDHPAATAARARPAAPPADKRLRRLRMGLQTLFGPRAKGFFSPYRYADAVAAPTRYAALDPLFQAARPEFDRVLDAVRRLRPALERIGADPAPQPRWSQSWFCGLDAAAAYALTVERRPNRVLEVGSGHSTRFIARAVADQGLPTKQICIDPAPRAALQGLSVEWRRELLDEAAHGDLFAGLEPGDVAVFDSSHLLFPGTDVDIILNRLLPRLSAGVLVHIHDVFLPAPYPDAWAWRGYNEQNALAPLLLGGGFRLIFASAYVRANMPHAADAALAEPHRPPAGAVETSFWLEVA